VKRPQVPPPWRPHISTAPEEKLVDAILAPKPRYWHWEELRHLAPPEGLTHEQWWAAIKVERASNRTRLPLRSINGEWFSIRLPPSGHEQLHLIDRMSHIPEALAGEDHERYAIGILMDEAIASSQLEGASTTRAVAKEMLRQGREPRTPHERMILNNYRAVLFVRERSREPLTPDLVLELHRIVTEGTLDDDDASGRLRGPRERVDVVDVSTGETLHVPPGAGDLAERMSMMCSFANGELDRQYIHPVVRAILVHFWLAYDHPFVDGNGRTARALFYWAMLRHDYSWAEFLPISRLLRKAPREYAESFLFAETDENDATYFVLRQLRVLDLALREFRRYRERKQREIAGIESRLRKGADFNARQLAVLGRALRLPSTRFTIASHRNSHRVVYQTARSDLLGLVAAGLLVQRRRGRAFVFEAAPDLAERLGPAPG